ncbi:MAG: nucleoid-associated protein YejK [Lonepinella koalarum]|nr:nucleoid-associated protein YejK [Lonepinella koalarum]
MSIIVNQIVLHQLTQHLENEGNITLTSQLRDQLLIITPEVEQLMLQLHQTYQSKSKGYGVFQSESNFARLLNQVLEQELDFLPFSHQAAHLLCTELAKYAFAESGTFVLCRYNFLATDYLFIALLDSRMSMLVDENLEIQQTEYLNISQFDIAARINLTDLQLNADSNRYLTFIKGRVGRKIGDFFMDFLGAESGLDPQVQNQCLLQAVNDYCEQGELNSEQTQAIKKQAFDYCKGQIKIGEEIILAELSAQLPTLNERDFVQFSDEQEYGLADSIPPMATTLKSFTKFSGSGKGVTISFDSDLMNKRIFWDEQADTLTLQGLPPNLRDQLQRHLKNQN